MHRHSKSLEKFVVVLSTQPGQGMDAWLAYTTGTSTLYSVSETAKRLITPFILHNHNILLDSTILTSRPNRN
jgi:hypothetical protein